MTQESPHKWKERESTHMRRAAAYTGLVRGQLSDMTGCQQTEQPFVVNPALVFLIFFLKIAFLTRWISKYNDDVHVIDSQNFLFCFLKRRFSICHESFTKSLFVVGS